MGLEPLGLSRSGARLFARSPEATLALLRAAWAVAVGPELARRTEVLGVEAGVLRVRVPDASWRKQLHGMRRSLVDRLVRVAGNLAPRRLGFLEGAVVSAVPAPTRPEPPAPVEPPASLVAEAQAIADPEIRERFLASAARYLGRTRRPDGAEGGSDA